MLRKTWAVTRKELRHIIRSPGMLFLVAASPVVMLVLMAYALAADIKSVPVAVFDQDLTPTSRAYIRQIMGGSDLDMVGYVGSLDAINAGLANNTIRAGIVIQAGFGQAMVDLDRFPVQIIIDGAEPASGGFAARHIAMRTQDFITGRVIAAAGAQGILPALLRDPVDVRLRVWYNPGLKAVQDVVPALIAVILGLPAVSMSAALAREKEHGSLEQLIASPLGKLELLVGKMIPYMLTGVLDVFLSLLVARLLFGVRFRGSLLLLLVLSGDYFIANLSIGLIISTYARTQQAAMIFALLIFLFPGFFLSGIFFPLIAMPAEARMEANMLPTTQFVTITRGLFLKGVGLDVLWSNALILLMIGLLCGGFAIVRFRKKLA
jgi:ABC-2 type transport system permease protein